jgi:hypothetical protein
MHTASKSISENRRIVDVQWGNFATQIDIPGRFLYA